MIVPVLRETPAALLVVVVLAACGATARPPPPANREWTANARGVIDQLRGDVVAVSGFDRAPAARRGLTDESELYGLLVSYTDIGGCRHMVAALGAEPKGRERAVVLLRQSCLRLQQADALFTRAVARNAPRLLVRATRRAVAAVPLLDAAALELAAGR
jgi:hypothetical protein